MRNVELWLQYQITFAQLLIQALVPEQNSVMERVGDLGYLWCKIEHHKEEGGGCDLRVAAVKPHGSTKNTKVNQDETTMGHFVGFTVLDDVVYVMDGIPGSHIFKGSKESFCKVLGNSTTRCIFETYLGAPFGDVKTFQIVLVEHTVSGIHRKTEPMINYYQEYHEFESAINHPVIVTQGDWRSAGGLVQPFNVRLISKKSDEWIDLDELMTNAGL